MEQLFKIEADRYEGYQLVDIASGLRSFHGYNLTEALKEKERLEAKGHRYTKRRDQISKIVAFIFAAAFGLLFAYGAGGVVYIFASLFGASDTIANAFAFSLGTCWFITEILLVKWIFGGEKKKYEFYPLIDLDNLPEGVVRASNE
jgi:hypothetical protein